MTTALASQVVEPEMVALNQLLYFTAQPSQTHLDEAVSAWDALSACRSSP